MEVIDYSQFNALRVCDHFQGKRVEIRFMKDTPSYDQYGWKVAGKISLLGRIIKNEDKRIIPRDMDMVKGTTNGMREIQLYSDLALIVNAGCQSLYDISEENVVELETSGFSLLDVEPNGIGILKG